MNENKNEEGDPPPDACPVIVQGEPPEDTSFSVSKSPRHVSDESLRPPEFDPDREYSISFVRQTEDDDPQYFRNMLKSYRGEDLTFYMDRGWTF